MLADFFIANNKYDLAEELLKKCLEYNKSLVKAEEFMGIIKEKEQMYVDAANHYVKAWRMSDQKNASVGFRLAFNYLKAKRIVECINICKEVLKTYPDYSLIKTEIMDKARLQLKA
ncbi:MAG: hypothetical protein IPK55_12940 [Streptococcus sp.]|nr:hypothetical protein [Streptococcus sp.]